MSAFLCLRWLLQLLDSTLFAIPATGAHTITVEQTGPLDVYLRIPRRLDTRLVNLTARVEGASGEVQSRWRRVTLGIFVAPGVMTYKGVRTLSACVGRVWFEAPGSYQVRIDVEAKQGELLFCRPTGSWIPVAIVAMIGSILAVPAQAALAVYVLTLASV